MTVPETEFTEDWDLVSVLVDLGRVRRADGWVFLGRLTGNE